MSLAIWFFLLRPANRKNGLTRPKNRLMLIMSPAPCPKKPLMLIMFAPGVGSSSSTVVEVPSSTIIFE